MIRLFSVYYPIRTLVLLIGEALIVWTSFLLGVWYAFGPDTYLALNVHNGYCQICVLTALVLLCSHTLDLYDTTRLNTKGALYFRLLMLIASIALILTIIDLVEPRFLLGGGSSTIGLLILTVGLIGWRLTFTWLVRLPILVERVYVLGNGERAERVVHRLLFHSRRHKVIRVPRAARPDVPLS